MNTYANYRVVSLTGSSGLSRLGDGVGDTSVHQVYCLASGQINLTAMGGGSFTWTATTGQAIDIVLSGYSVTSGTFIGFAAKYYPHQNLPYYRTLS